MLVLVTPQSTGKWKETSEVIVDILDCSLLPIIAVEVRKSAIHRSGHNKVDLKREDCTGTRSVWWVEGDNRNLECIIDIRGSHRVEEFN